MRSGRILENLHVCSTWETFAKKRKSFVFPQLYFGVKMHQQLFHVFLGYLEKSICSYPMPLTLVKGLSINNNLVRERCQRNEKPTNDFPPYQSRKRTCSVGINSMSGHNDMLQWAFGCTWQFSTIKSQQDSNLRSVSSELNKILISVS